MLSLWAFELYKAPAYFGRSFSSRRNWDHTVYSASRTRKSVAKKVNDNQKIFEKVENKEFSTLKFGFIKQVCKGRITTVKVLESWRFER